MKRMLALLLAFCLLAGLCACGKPDLPPAPATTEPTTTTEPATTPTTAAPPTTAPAPEPAFFSLKTLPDIGAFVSDEKKAYFFPDGAHDSFEAREDYGEIVPYVAVAEKYFGGDWDFDDEGLNFDELDTELAARSESGFYVRFGFATADGKIITDGLFEDMFRFEDASGAVIYAAYPGQAFEMGGEVYLITGDGSRVLHFEDDEIYMEPLYEYGKNSGEGLLGFRNYKTERVWLVNYSGEVVFDHSPASADDPMLYIEYADRDGLLVRKDEDGDMRYYRWTYDGKQTFAFPKKFNYLRDVGGNDVLIMAEDDWYRLVSMDGRELTDTAFTNLHWSDRYNCFFAETDGEMQRFDADGKKIGDLVEDFGLLEKEYDCNYLYDPQTHSLLDQSFTRVPLQIDSGRILQLDEIFDETDAPGSCLLKVRASNEDVYVFDNDGNRLAKFQDVTYWEDDDRYVQYDGPDADVKIRSYNLYADDGVLFAEKKNGVEIRDLHTGYTAAVSFLHGDSFRSLQTLSSHVLALEYEKDIDFYQRFYNLYRREDGKRFLTGAVYTESFGNRIVAATPTHSYLMDETGKVLLCLKNDKLV